MVAWAAKPSPKETMQGRQKKVKIVLFCSNLSRCDPNPLFCLSESENEKITRSKSIVDLPFCPFYPFVFVFVFVAYLYPLSVGFVLCV